LSPTERTRLGRLAEKGRTEREELHELLDTALVAHVGLDAGGYPLVLPTAFAVDLQGPDRGGTLYIHGSTGARWINQSRGANRGAVPGSGVGLAICLRVAEAHGGSISLDPDFAEGNRFLVDLPLRQSPA